MMKTEAYDAVESQIPSLFDEIREGLEAKGMLLEEMVKEMRKIRETSNYEPEAKRRPGNHSLIWLLEADVKS